MDPRVHGPCGQRDRAIQGREDRLSPQQRCRDWTPRGKRTNLNLCLIQSAQIPLKWTTDLNIKAETVKILDVNIGENLHNLEIGKDFLQVYRMH